MNTPETMTFTSEAAADDRCGRLNRESFNEMTVIVDGPDAGQFTTMPLRDAARFLISVGGSMSTIRDPANLRPRLDGALGIIRPEGWPKIVDVSEPGLTPLVDTREGWLAILWLGFSGALTALLAPAPGKAEAETCRVVKTSRVRRGPTPWEAETMRRADLLGLTRKD